MSDCPKGTCSRLKTVRKDVHIPIPETCEHVVLHAKTDFNDITTLRIMRWGDFPGLPRRAQYNHKGPYKREAGASESEKAIQWYQQEKNGMMIELDVGRLCFETGGRGHEPRNASWKRQEHKICPRAFRRNTAL